MKTKNATLALVLAGPKYDQMKTKTYAAKLPADYTAFCAIDGYLLAYASKSGRLDSYANPAKGKLGKPVHSATVATGFDVLLPFALGTVTGKSNVPMVLGYDPATGSMQFFTIDGAALDAENAWQGPKSCTTILPFLSWDGSYVLCYDMVSGTVGTYQLSAGTGGSVTVKQVWKPSKPWAKGWTRFGPFLFGPENFFIKTNIDYGHAFIDHLLDDASEGSHPAREDVPLDLKLTAVTPFTLLGDPCFATYVARNGKVTLNRFHGDLTWTTGAGLDAVKKGSLGVALTTKEPMLLFY